jgi:hypothetical protein
MWHTSLPDFFIQLQRNTTIWKQFLISNDRNNVCWEVLGLSQDGACIDLVENLSENSLKVDLSLLPLSTHLFSHWSILLKKYLEGLVNFECPFYFITLLDGSKIPVSLTPWAGVSWALVYRISLYK